MFVKAKEFQKLHDEKMVRDELHKHSHALNNITEAFRIALKEGKDSIVVSMKGISFYVQYEMYQKGLRRRELIEKMNENQRNTFDLIDILERNGYYVGISGNRTFIAISYHPKPSRKMFSQGFLLEGVVEENSIENGSGYIFKREDDYLRFNEIKFEVPFEHPPHVTALLDEEAHKGEAINISVSDVTNEGFRVWASKNSKHDVEVNVTWIACKL